LDLCDQRFGRYVGCKPRTLCKPDTAQMEATDTAFVSIRALAGKGADTAGRRSHSPWGSYPFDGCPCLRDLDQNVRAVHESCGSIGEHRAVSLTPFPARVLQVCMRRWVASADLLGNTAQPAHHQHMSIGSSGSVIPARINQAAAVVNRCRRPHHITAGPAAQAGASAGRAAHMTVQATSDGRRRRFSNANPHRSL
jgi:hypothetical protein